jgi:hypothetical protein
MLRYDSSVRGPLDQGDILRPVEIKRLLPWWPDNKALPLVVLTPTCDLAQSKAEHHRYCVMQPFCLLLYVVGEDRGLDRDHWAGRKPVGKDKSREIRQKLRTALRNAWPRYHFLPKQPGVFETDYLIDFEVVITTPLSHFAEPARLARIAAPFQQELVQRYAAHVMRIGTPDVTPEQQDATIAHCLTFSGLQLAAA